MLTKCLDFLSLIILFHQTSGGFKRGDLFINQLVSITHEIYKSSGDRLEVRGVFLDISKAFNKVRQEELIFKWKQNDISGDFKYYLIFWVIESKELFLRWLLGLRKLGSIKKKQRFMAHVKCQNLLIN